MADVRENAKLLSALGIEYVKLHSLYVVRGTVLGDMYKKGKVEIISLADYIERVAEFLAYLDPEMVIQRLVGKGPRADLLFSNWGLSWWLVKQHIEEYLVQKNIYQGGKFDYLNGKGIRYLLPAEE
jgi:radical SAM superfamily enzyme